MDEEITPEDNDVNASSSTDSVDASAELPITDSQPPSTDSQPPSSRRARTKRTSKARKKTVASPRQAPKAKSDTVKIQRPYPRVTLKEAEQVAFKIKELNGGNPWDTPLVANSLEMGARTAKFFYITAASRDFGLTIGTRETAKIELTELGRDLVYAPNSQVEHEKRIEAFLKVDIFRRVLDHYKGGLLPEMKYLGNTLEKEFGLHPDVHEEFSLLFRRNCQELGINAGVDGSQKFESKDGSTPDSKRSSTITIGEQSGVRRTGLKAFVIMPFVERNDDHPKGFFAEVLRSLITPAALAAGFVVETANKHGSDIIQSTIINDLLEADLVIADLTAHNPNVLFELGVRMAEDKPVALIKSTGTGRIFDVDNMLRVLEYDANLWQSTVETDLPKLIDHFKAAWENRDTNQSYMKILRRGDLSVS